MTTFVICATLMIGISLVALLRARETAGGAGSARRPTNTLLIVGVPALTIAAYVVLGRPDAIDPPQDVERAMAEQRTDRLAARLETQTDDIAGLRLLARSYERLRRFDDATHAYARLAALQPNDADALVDLAQAQSTTQGGHYAGEPIALARRALMIDGEHARALAIAANEAVERDDLVAAIDYRERIRSQVAPDSEIARSLQACIDEARQALAARGDARPRSASIVDGSASAAR